MSTALSPFKPEVQPVAQRLALHRLDPAKDALLIEYAFSWLLNSPTWRQHTEEVFGTLNYQDYVAAHNDERRIDIAVFEGKYHRATITLHLVARNTYEVSLQADRRTSVEVISAAGQAIAAQLFGLYAAEAVYAWIPRWAKGVARMAQAIGFTSDYVTMARGTARGRLVEWERFSLRREDVQQEQATDHPGPEPGV